MKWSGEIVDICGGCRRIVTNSFIAIPTALLELNSNEIYNQQKTKVETTLNVKYVVLLLNK